MMPSHTPDRPLVEFLQRTGLAARADEAVWTPLAGGVSSDIWRVDLPSRVLCIKRALPKLKVARPWTAPVERNRYEWAWLEFAARHCPGRVPRPVANDPAHAIFAMEFLDPARYPVWKGLLLDGIAQPALAASVATIVARVHMASAGDAGIARAFATDAIFHAIRIEPYLLATAARHADLAAPLRALAERTASTRRALVHGDVSPKNILVGPDGPVLIDAECAWYGDPAFDAAFCLNHLLLKCIARPACSDAYLRCFAAFARAYLAGVGWEPREDVEARVASLLPALALARIDGKSPVEYIAAEADREHVRATMRPMVADAPRCIEDVAGAWRKALAAR
jgi:aminoglycoside phosphotransferase (APT) family kinase protein